MTISLLIISLIKNSPIMHTGLSLYHSHKHTAGHAGSVVHTVVLMCMYVTVYCLLCCPYALYMQFCCHCTMSIGVM